MTAKQWAARAVLAATMAAGLSACGGGGDGAAPVAAPETLKVGLTIKESTDAAFPVSNYESMRIEPEGNVETSTQVKIYAENSIPGSPDHVELTALFDKNTQLVTRVVFLKVVQNNSFLAVGCGFDSHPCDNSKVTLNPATSEVRVTSLPLKTLAFSSTRSAQVISDGNTRLSPSPNTVVVSGIVNLP